MQLNLCAAIGCKKIILGQFSEKRSGTAHDEGGKMVKINLHFVLKYNIMYNILFSAGNEGTHFVFSFPLGSTEYTFETEIRITSREEARVTLLSATSNDVIIVPGGGRATYVGDPSQRVRYGLEDKGFELRSDSPVSVTIGSPDYSNIYSPDNMLLRPIAAGDIDFVITSFVGSYRGTQYAPLSFFSITASDDGTTISIYDNNGATYTTQSLNKLVTFGQLLFNFKTCE